MKIEHIGLTIKDPEEIESFYCELLGMRRVRDFILHKDVSAIVFGINTDIQVSFLEKDGLTIELFVFDHPNKNPINHVCVSVPDRGLLVQKAQYKGYTHTRIKRPEYDLVFLKDKSGNLFEVRRTNS